jgi:hypothetical protein
MSDKMLYPRMDLSALLGGPQDSSARQRVALQRSRGQQERTLTEWIAQGAMIRRSREELARKTAAVKGRNQHQNRLEADL